jgi:dTDP-4-dehydrorhamnose 3,5-epimerase-like enzyme
MQLRDKIEIIKRHLIVDSRGYFLKVLTGTEKGLLNTTGEIYISVANPGESKGGHYHSLATEWFTIIQGESTLHLEDVNTKERMDYVLSSKEPYTVMIPPNVAHLFCNNSSQEFILLAYSSRLYDPNDTIPYQINSFLSE